MSVVVGVAAVVVVVGVAPDCADVVDVVEVVDFVDLLDLAATVVVDLLLLFGDVCIVCCLLLDLVLAPLPAFVVLFVCLDWW